MKIGICSANSGLYTSADALVRLAEAAEAAGVESIWVSEHLVVSDPRVPPSPMDPEDPILEPLATLAFLAGRTRSVRLGTGIVVLPLRNPLILAKELATIDVLANGRLIVGVGVGYVEREFEALGVPFEDRGTRTDEYLAALRSLWTEPHPFYAGRFVSFGGVQAHPRPVQRPHPPIVVGGCSGAALRRAVAQAEGWYGWGLDLADTARILARLREAQTHDPRQGSLGDIEVTITPPNDVDAPTVERYAELGVHRLNLMLPSDLGDRDLEGFFEEVVQPVIDAQRF